MWENSPDVPSAWPERTLDSREVDCWQASVLIEIANFAALRRRVGRRRADEMAPRLAARIATLLPASRAAAVGWNRVEAALDRCDPATLGDQLVRIEAMLATVEGEGADILPLHLVIGAAVGHGDAADEVGLVEEAELACEDAHRDRVPVVRTLENATSWTDRATLARDLGRAIRDGELRLDYQPKLHLRRRMIVSLEALVRWHHPERGLIPPSDFIPLAEESNDIAALTLWVIDRVVADQRALAASGHDLPVFVNIAGVLLADRAFVDDAAARVGPAAGRVGFEITETSVIRDPEVAIGHLKLFADMGIAIAIDDYGAGLSSLAYLKQLPACELKIDKLFVTKLASSHRDPLIVRSTIDLAHAMEMEVVAEGVETMAALALLSVMGCDMAQGYLISRPLTLPAMLAFLDRHGGGWEGEVAAAPLFRVAGGVTRG